MFELVYRLQGYKTYIIAIIIAVVNLLVALNAINPSRLAQINAVLAALGAAALRAGVKKAE